MLLNIQAFITKKAIRIRLYLVKGDKNVSQNREILLALHLEKNYCMLVYLSDLFHN